MKQVIHMVKIKLKNQNQTFPLLLNLFYLDKKEKEECVNGIKNRKNTKIYDEEYKSFLNLKNDFPSEIMFDDCIVFYNTYIKLIDLNKDLYKIIYISVNKDITLFNFFKVIANNLNVRTSRQLIGTNIYTQFNNDNNFNSGDKGAPKEEDMKNSFEKVFGSSLNLYSKSTISPKVTLWVIGT